MSAYASRKLAMEDLTVYVAGGIRHHFATARTHAKLAGLRGDVKTHYSILRTLARSVKQDLVCAWQGHDLRIVLYAFPKNRNHAEEHFGCLGCKRQFAAWTCPAPKMKLPKGGRK